MTCDRFRAPRPLSSMRPFRPKAAQGAASSSAGAPGLSWQRPEGRAASRGRVRGLFLMLALLGIATTARAGMVQIGQAADFRSLAEDNRSRGVAVPAERGSMVDRHGRSLVENVPDFSATLVPERLPEDPASRQAAILAVAEAAGLAPGDVDERLAEFKTFPSASVTVAENLTQEQAVRLGILEDSVDGLAVVSGMRRTYPMGEALPSLSHVIGYVGRATAAELEARAGQGYGPSDVAGKTGLERTYEADLRGIFGSRRVEVDSAGRAKHVIAERPPVPGSTLVLAIDADLQAAAQKALTDELRATSTKRGSAIVMDPRNGEILALVSLPGYDNNLFAGGISQKEYSALADDPDHPLFPRAVSGSLPAGSTFKPVVAAAALDEGVAGENTLVQSDGGIKVNQWYFPDWKAGGHGWTDVKKAIAESVNSYFYVVGGGHEDRPGLGPERIVAYARKFGFGQALGIDLPGEGKGFLPTREWKEQTKGESWYIGDTYHLAIGQGDLLATPLQVSAMTMAVANGGTVWRPTVVSAVRQPDGKVVTRKPEAVLQNAASAGALDVVRRGMRQTAVSGSAQSVLGTLNVPVAAKSGTAQWRSNRLPHAWLTAFAPFKDPEVVVTVVVEEGGEGSGAGQRAAGAILKWYFDPARTPATEVDAPRP
jgi:penicillin-binding protein 2